MKYPSEYVCASCELPLVRVGTNIFRHAAVMAPTHDPRFPPKTCGTKPKPIPIGQLLAKKNFVKTRQKTRRPVDRSIDVTLYPDHVLAFWASKIARGTSYRDLGMAYGMNGIQMRSYVSYWSMLDKRIKQILEGK